MNVLLQLLPLLLFPIAPRTAPPIAFKAPIAIEKNVAVVTIHDQIISAQVVTVVPPVDVRTLAHQITTSTFGDSQWPAMNSLILMESGYNNVYNKGGSGACGIPQALPCSKLPQGINTPLAVQIQWMCAYIKNRYGTPSSALAFHQANGWY